MSALNDLHNAVVGVATCRHQPLHTGGLRLGAVVNLLEPGDEGEEMLLFTEGNVR
jgi:hypothetical protein